MLPAAVGFTRAPAWAAHYAHSASTTPTWVAAVEVVACVLFVVCVVWLLAAGSGPAGLHDGEDDLESGAGGGGGGGGGPSSGPDGRDAPGGEPAWWPEFERQFAAHVAARTAGVGARPGVGARAGVGARVGGYRRPRAPYVTRR